MSGTQMKIGSMAMELMAEYGDDCPGAISLRGSSCKMRWPADASHAVNGARSPMSPMPQLLVDGNENSGMARPARRARRLVMGEPGASKTPQDAVDAGGKRLRGDQQTDNQERFPRKIE